MVYKYYFIPAELHQFYLYFANAHVWQHLCVVRVYVDCVKLLFTLFSFYAKVMAAQSSVVKKMYLFGPSFPPFFYCVF